MTKKTKKKWLKPTMTPFRMGGINKFGGTGKAIWRSEIDGVAVADLVTTHGSPLFIYSERSLRQNYDNCLRAFTARYPRVQLAWSYKTNYLGAVCNILHQQGAMAEVVSRFEYEKARQLGVPGNCIIFNGPHKPRDILIRAIDENAYLHIDNLDELFLVEELAQELERKVAVGIRLNFDTGYTEPWSRFGFNVESGQAMDAVWRIQSSRHLKLRGLHSHIGTFVLDAKAYHAQARQMCEFMLLAEEKTECRIEYLDVGGGFASMNSLQGVYLPPDQVVPSMDQYAEAICEMLLEMTHERESQGIPRPTLIIESGRALVDDAGTLAATVVANKRLPDGRRALVMDAGVNLLFTAYWYNHSVTPIEPLEGKPEETVIYGPLCMNIDVMRAQIMLPPINLGNTLLFHPVGAYNNTQWQQFIEYRPNVVLINTTGEAHVIRTRENLDVVIQQEVLPQHLLSPYPKHKPKL